MRSKMWIPLVLSLVLGLGAALVAGRALKAPKAAKAATDVSVVVAARDIDAGTMVTLEDLGSVKYPVKDVPPEAFTDPSQAVGRISVASLVKGQLAIEKLLASKDSPAGLQALVPPGMRAITMEVSEFSGLAGMLTAGARVDVIAMLRDEKSKEPAARTIVQDIPVLAVGRATGNGMAMAGDKNAPPPLPTSITLLATPKQAQALQLASQGGRPWLVLRGYRDTKQINPGITNQAALRGDDTDFMRELAAFVAPAEGPTPSPAGFNPTTQPAVAPQAVAELPQRTVRVILGNDEQRLSFPADPRFEQPQFGKTELAPEK
jgi:pilus assembly protein CpaB